jgi:hypothetical protein
VPSYNPNSKSRGIRSKSNPIDPAVGRGSRRRSHSAGAASTAGRRGEGEDDAASQDNEVHRHINMI